jgi:hypothetical protein
MKRLVLSGMKIISGSHNYPNIYITTRLILNILKRNLKSGRSTSSKSVLFLSDMHVGNQTAICTPNPAMKGGSYNPNKLQKQLYEFWLQARDKCPKPHILVLNGEPTDGSTVKQAGDQEWSTVIKEQLNDATKLLKQYSPKYFLMTRGSNYHVQLGADNQEEILAERLQAVPYSGLFDVERDMKTEGIYAQRTDYFLNFKVNQKVFSVTHHIGFNRWFAYRTTAIAREMADMEFMRGRYWKSEDMPSVIVRSHAHYFVLVRFTTVTGFITPAWKFPDGHLFRGGLGGTAPSIGSVEVIVEPNGDILVNPHIMTNSEYPKHNILDLSK